MGSLDRGKSWHFRAPRYLVVPHLDVMRVLEEYSGVHCFLNSLEHLYDEKNMKNDRLPYGLTWDWKSHVIENVAEFAVGLRDAISVAAVSYYAVEEEFGAAADEIVEHIPQGCICRRSNLIHTSWHSWLLYYAKSTQSDIRRRLGVEAPGHDFDYEVDHHIQETFTAQDVIDGITKRGILIHKMASSISRIEKSLLETLHARLEQEMFRAWKRRFPNDQESYEKLEPDSNEAKQLVVRQEKARQEEIRALTLRPAYSRDHKWLAWSTKDKMKPAAIRDRWDAMSDDERRAVCPGAWERIGEAGKEAGRDIVKKGLEKARNERTQ